MPIFLISGMGVRSWLQPSQSLRGSAKYRAFDSPPKYVKGGYRDARYGSDWHGANGREGNRNGLESSAPDLEAQPSSAQCRVRRGDVACQARILNAVFKNALGMYKPNERELRLDREQINFSCGFL